MVPIRKPLEIQNNGSDREHGPMSVENDDSKTIATEDLNITKSDTKNKNKRRKKDSNCNMFDIENGDTEVVKQFKKILKFLFLPGLSIGARYTFYWKPQNHCMFWLALFCLISTGLNCTYTNYLHTRNGDILRNLEVFSLYGIFLSCVFKFVLYLTHFKKILALLNFMLKICRQNSIGRRAEILKNGLRKCFYNLKIFAIFALANITLFLFVPPISYFLRNEIISLAPFEYFLVDQSTLFGYIVANGLMSINGLFAAAGTAFFANVYMFLISSFSIQVELIGDSFKQLDELWADKKQSLNYRRSFLRDICTRCQDMNNYIAAIKSIFDLKMFAFFSVAYISQIICLFEIRMHNWIPGYAIAFGLFEEIMLYCYVGTMKSTANERICAIIYSTNWYEYDTLSQMTILSLLHSYQTASELEIGPLAPMNLSTGVQIIKSIYTYYTILAEVL